VTENPAQPERGPTRTARQSDGLPVAPHPDQDRAGHAEPPRHHCGNGRV